VRAWKDRGTGVGKSLVKLFELYLGVFSTHNPSCMTFDIQKMLDDSF
jgi:hypothetical protein